MSVKKSLPKQYVLTFLSSSYYILILLDGTLKLLGVFGDNVAGDPGYAISLQGFINVQISPDGKNVYAFGHYSSTIVIWNREIIVYNDGTIGPYVLTNQRQIVDAENLGYCKSGGGGAICTDTGGQPYDDGAMLPKALAISPDGRTVYLVGFRSKSIVSWTRNGNGDLTNKGE